MWHYYSLVTPKRKNCGSCFPSLASNTKRSRRAIVCCRTFRVNRVPAATVRPLNRVRQKGETNEERVEGASVYIGRPLYLHRRHRSLNRSIQLNPNILRMHLGLLVNGQGHLITSAEKWMYPCCRVCIMMMNKRICKSGNVCQTV